jgi:crotonobetainyl-CoA:carnitine CoA-transferase CaiB-like acyl-CoA transferase
MTVLQGVRVIEVGDLGEVAGKLLADAGAEVVRIEPPSGGKSRLDGPYARDVADANSSLAFAYWNTSKLGITLDLGRTEAEEVYRRLLATADVVIDGAGAGVLDALGLGWEACSANDRLIWCSITPFGREGPWRDFRANDLVSLALGGPMMSNGYDDHDLPPIRPDGRHSLSIAGQYACIGALTALLQRNQTGRGQLVDVSMHEAIACTTEGAFNNWEYNRKLVQRQTNRHASPAPTPPWSLRCSDGRYVALMGGGYPRDARVWDTLRRWMEEEGAAGELAGRTFPGAGTTADERESVMRTIHRFVESLPSEVAYRRGQASHLPWGLVRRPEENLDDLHWQDRDFFTEVEVPGVSAPARIPGAPYRFSSTPVGARSRAPLLGEHNFQVFSRLGYEAQQLVTWAKAGVI